MANVINSFMGVFWQGALRLPYQLVSLPGNLASFVALIETINEQGNFVASMWDIWVSSKITGRITQKEMEFTKKYVNSSIAEFSVKFTFENRGGGFSGYFLVDEQSARKSWYSRANEGRISKKEYPFEKFLLDWRKENDGRAFCVVNGDLSRLPACF